MDLSTIGANFDPDKLSPPELLFYVGKNIEQLSKASTALGLITLGEKLSNIRKAISSVLTSRMYSDSQACEVCGKPLSLQPSLTCTDCVLKYTNSRPTAPVDSCGGYVVEDSIAYDPADDEDQDCTDDEDYDDEAESQPLDFINIGDGFVPTEYDLYDIIVNVALSIDKLVEPLRVIGISELANKLSNIRLAISHYLVYFGCDPDRTCASCSASISLYPDSFGVYDSNGAFISIKPDLTCSRCESEIKYG